MPSSNIEVLEVGMPGPSGAGVTAAEKATFVTLSGSNVFTNTNEVRLSNTAAFIAASGANTTDRSLVLDTTNKEVEFWNGAALRGFTGAGTGLMWGVGSATGNAFFNEVFVSRITGEVIYLTLPTIDGAGSVITSGVKYDFIVPYNLTVQEWTLLNDVSGSISIELWKDTYAVYPPTVADLVSGTTGTNNPRTSSANKNRSSTLTNWTTAWTQGDIIRVNVVSATTVTRTGILLKVAKT